MLWSYRQTQMTMNSSSSSIQNSDENEENPPFNTSKLHSASLWDAVCAERFSIALDSLMIKSTRVVAVESLQVGRRSKLLVGRTLTFQCVNKDCRKLRVHLQIHFFGSIYQWKFRVSVNKDRQQVVLHSSDSI